MSRSGALAALALPLVMIIASPSLADEIWQDGPLTVIWEAEDVEGYAVFAFTLDDAKQQRTGRIYLYGLRGDDDERATFGGYWASDTGQACPMAIVDAYGEEHWAWGAVELTFDAPAFPAGWSAALGICFDNAQEFWTVEPGLGE